MLPKKNRLTSNHDFKAACRKGKKIRTPLFNLYFLRTEQGASSRFGFVVSTKLDKRAAKRNRVKRIFREGVRSALSQIKDGFDLVFWANHQVMEAEGDQIRATIRSALKKSRVLADD